MRNATVLNYSKSRTARLSASKPTGMRRYSRRSQKAPPIRLLGDYRQTKESRGGMVRAFGPGTIIKATDRAYLVTQQGNFLRGYIDAFGKFSRHERIRNHERKAA